MRIIAQLVGPLEQLSKQKHKTNIKFYGIVFRKTTGGYFSDGLTESQTDRFTDHPQVRLICLSNPTSEEIKQKNVW